MVVAQPLFKGGIMDIPKILEKLKQEKAHLKLEQEELQKRIQQIDTTID